MNVSLQEVSERDNTIHIDVSLIPEYTKEDLASATLAFIRRLTSTPEGRAAMKKKAKELGWN